MPWYPRDFAADEPVQLMSLAEEGAYRRLLDHQWLHGSIPGDIPSLARICKNIPVREMRKIWGGIEPLFSRMPGQPPRLQNGKLERVRRQRQEFIDHQREAGSRGGKARWEKERERQAHEASDSKPTSDPTSEPTETLVAQSYLAVASASAVAEELLTKATPSGEARPTEVLPGVTRNELLGSLRKVCGPRKGKIGEAAMRTNASVLDTLADRNWTYAEIHQAASGTRNLIDRGKIPSIPAGAEWTLKVLLDATPDVDPMQRGLDAFRAQPPPTSSEKRGGVASGIADVLDFTKFAREAG
jgi:uncharacterized protein YdaU (DUF1376 family)